MIRFASLLLVLAATAGAKDGPLLNSRDFSGWALETTPAAHWTEVAHFKSGDVLAVAGKPSGFFATRESYRDYHLHVEWRWPGKPGNGGVLVHVTTGPKDRVWPASFQIQLKHGAAGDLLPMAGATFREPLTSPPGTTAIRAHQAPDSEAPAGQWNTCDITCRGALIEVLINGVLQNHVTACSAAAGRIGFQLEGSPFELRHVRVSAAD
jgi:hypothetical protein